MIVSPLANYALYLFLAGVQGAGAVHRHINSLARRQSGDCTAIQVAKDDTCDTLASKCTLEPGLFKKLHAELKDCAKPPVGQWVCCTLGKLPDMRPKADANGMCHTFHVGSGDDCDKIAAANGVQRKDIEDFNKNTWGFYGCKDLAHDTEICVSLGDPPMPAPIPDAKCGPQVPDTKKPTKKDVKLADLNPCPLNACCNASGQCGTTKEFCDKPGHSDSEHRGCISSCGTDIISSDAKVAASKKMDIGYFEGSNNNRKCLHMDVNQISDKTSHIHFAFLDVGDGFKTSVGERTKDQWEKFKKMKDHHKVAVFGGWEGSKQPTSYWIFREGVKPENRDKLATSLAKFISSNGMDGISLDWEYPGAQDLPERPTAAPLDGKAFLELLKVLRKKLDKNKTISIMAPSSYSSLQSWPIKEISDVVNYIVYMTMDLHGQWEFDSKHPAPGCKEKGCVRSHVDMLDTMNALSMITKAGVPSHMIVVSVPSYGRAFELKDPNCSSANCAFTGPESGAQAGRCTDKAGFIANGEITDLMKSDKVTRTYDGVAESRVLVYDKKQWISYLEEPDKAKRRDKFLKLNFGGTADWALDLVTFTPGDKNPDSWKSKTCYDAAVVDASINPVERWESLATDDAFDAAVKSYRDKKKTNPDSFTRYVSHFFQGPASMDCAVLAGENGCHAFTSCMNGTDFAPAGGFILNGFVALSNIFLNLYEGIEDAQQNLEVGGVLEDFVNNFAPKPKKDMTLEIILEIVTFGLTAITGPFVSTCLKLAPLAKLITSTTKKDNIKETTFALSSFASMAALTHIHPKDPKGESGADMSAQLATIVSQYKVGLTEVSKQLFSGTDDGIETLRTTINYGQLLDTVASSKLGLEARLSKLFFAMLIPYLWRLKEWSPILVDTGVGCKEKFTSSILGNDKGKICFEDKQYHLLRTDGACMWSEQRVGISRTEAPKKLANFPGLDKLTGKDYGGLTKEDIVASIVNRMKTGMGNPAEISKWPSFANPNDFNTMWDWINSDNMVQSPGLIDVPMCGVDEIKRNWGDTMNTYAAWPCNRVQ